MLAKHGHNNTLQGFTLVEVSIVLVIIGLLVGGILVGRDLIHVAELRSTISQKEKFTTAVNTFSLKYNCMPGDCIDADSLFGITPYYADPNEGIVNPPGDGVIYAWGDDPSQYWFWQELFLAGLSSQQPNCSSGVGFTCADVYPGYTTPRCTICNPSNSPVIGYPAIVGGWLVIDLAADAATLGCGTYPTPVPKFRALMLTSGNVSVHSGYSSTITPADGFSFDSKIDDGNAFTGSVIATDPSYIGPCDPAWPTSGGAVFNAPSACANSSNPYDSSHSNAACFDLVMNAGF